MSKKFTIEAIFAAKDRLSAPIAKVIGGLGRLGRAGKKAFGALDGTATKALKGIGKFGKTFANEIGIASVLSVGALGFELQNVMQKGAELEKTLIRTGSAFEKPVRVGTEGFQQLKDAARNVGMTTEFSAQQGAEALNSLATAGYTVEQSIAALPLVMDFASAAVLELDQASDITSDTLGAFSLRTNDAAKNAAQMGRVMDTLTRTAADSTTNVSELFEGIRAGGAFASTAGASLEEFAAIQGVLANKGFKGAEAGTAIRNSYLHLTKQTKEAADMQKKLGVVTAKNKDGSIDLMTTVGRFTEKTKKLTRAKKAEAIATIFGAYTVGPFLALMDAGEGSIRKFADNLEDATGITKEMAEATRASTSAKIAKFFNILENVRLTVFDAIAPAVMGIADAVGKWVTANEKLIGQKAAEWVTALKDNLPQIWTWTVRVAEAFGVFVAVALTVKAVNTAILAYETAVKLATGVTWLWNTATKAVALAQAAYSAVLAVTTGGLAAFRVAALSSVPAITAQVVAMAPMLAMVAAAAAAVLALVAAWDQYNKLDKSLEGSGGITGTVGKMIEMGTFDPFAAHDAVMNEKAIAARREADKPKVVSPAARAASEAAEAGATASVDGTITVEAKPGTKASVSKTRPGTMPLKLAPSGAL